jgi:hypothetical protein
MEGTGHSRKKFKNPPKVYPNSADMNWLVRLYRLLRKDNVGSINSVASNLTALGESVSGPSNPASTRAANHTTPASALQDVVAVATVPSLSQVEPLQKTGNPSQFQVVLTDAVRQLRAAAFQTTDPIEAAYLSSLADRFQQMEESGVPSQSSSAAAGT